MMLDPLTTVTRLILVRTFLACLLFVVGAIIGDTDALAEVNQLADAYARRHWFYVGNAKGGLDGPP